MIIKKNKDEAFLLTHLGLGDNILCISIVYYLLEKYKKVHYVCKKRNYKNLALLLNDERINFIQVDEDYQISPCFGFNMYHFFQFTKDWDLYLCGMHKFEPSCNDFPLGFYDDLKITRRVFWDYFKIQELQESKDLYDILKQNDVSKYIVIHNNASTGKIFHSKDIIKKYCQNDQDLFVLNFNENEYDPGHKFYELAQHFINKPIPHYVDIIINATYVFLTDSSIFCLSLQLPIKTDDCYYLARGNMSYEIIYEDFNPEKNKRFKRILI